MAVLLFAIATAGLMAVAGNTGGDIRHPEIVAEDAAPSAIAAMGAKTVLALRYFIIDYSRWVWPLVETFHFIGLIMLVGAVGILSLRILGFMKQLPVGPLHRLIPMGIAGLAINVITGFLFFIGMPFFYVFNWYFQLKILAIGVAGAMLVLFYCTGLFRKSGNVGPGEDAPGLAKLVALSSIVLWVVIVVIGRYIPLWRVRPVERSKDSDDNWQLIIGHVSTSFTQCLSNTRLPIDNSAPGPDFFYLTARRRVLYPA